MVGVRGTTITYFDPIFFIFAFISFVSFAWFTVNWLPLGLNTDEGSLGIKALASLVLAGVGFIGARWIGVETSVGGLPKDRRWTILLTILIGTVSAIGLQWFVIWSLSLGAISNEVRMLFFLSIVPLEELFFRYFVHNGGRYLINLFGVKNPWVLSIVGTTVSSSIFMMFHWGVYGQQIQFLWATFALGAVLALSYDYTGHLSVPVAVHFIINLLATRGVVFFLPPPG
jgi:membrane protease YdiL (CAAX protease family)